MTQVEHKTRAAMFKDSHVFSSLVKAMQRTDTDTGRKSLRKKVGSMVYTVFGKPNKFPHGNDEALNDMIESLDIRSDKTIVKSSDDKAGDRDGEGQEEPSGGSGRKEGRRSYSKYLRKRVGIFGSDESSDGEEVWRKRILLGRKCRPLTGSWVIQYDENGVLIPESDHMKCTYRS